MFQFRHAARPRALRPRTRLSVAVVFRAVEQTPEPATRAPASVAPAPPIARATLWGSLAWLGGGVTTAFQPSRLAAGFLLALLIWLPGLGWDALTGRNLDATGYLGEPYDDTERAAVQATLRRIAAEHVPDRPFESAQIDAHVLAELLHERAIAATTTRNTLLVAAARASSLAPIGSFQALVRAEAVAASMVIDGVFGASPADIALGVRLAVWETPRGAWQRDPVFFVIFGLWLALVLAVGAGAMARMEAVQLAGRGVPEALDGFRFAAERWSDLVLAWLAPLGIAAVLGLACVAWGLLFGTEATGWFAGALYIVPLGIGIVVALVLVVGTLGAPFAPAAVACDGLDALDASQRGAIYAIGRPGLWLAVMLAMTVICAGGLAALRVIGWVVTTVTATAVGTGADAASAAVVIDALRVTPADAPVAWTGPAVAISWWVALVSVGVAGAFLSLLGGTLTRGYLALRERCDGQSRLDIWPFEIPADVSDEPATNRAS